MLFFPDNMIDYVNNPKELKEKRKKQKPLGTNK